MVKKNSKELPTKSYSKKMHEVLRGKKLREDGKERFEKVIEKELNRKDKKSS